ncbi:hypothetical protein BJ508DRAFT_26773 [Ascobolus immersus RN42]|uniref:Transmembrane protein n=1 Tax=Ascobolus immersus RN42 TaxID=1160509 RepID=A0A3N4IKV4_ASCIM|nr:hypothetical protein BJ508DRAFT_26773 [Ascobolus immersus RN42]
MPRRRQPFRLVDSWHHRASGAWTFVTGIPVASNFRRFSNAEFSMLMLMLVRYFTFRLFFFGVINITSFSIRFSGFLSTPLVRQFDPFARKGRNQTPPPPQESSSKGTPGHVRPGGAVTDVDPDRALPTWGKKDSQAVASYRFLPTGLCILPTSDRCLFSTGPVPKYPIGFPTFPSLA